MTVEQVIGYVFKVESDKIDDLSSRETIPGWDSMGHLSLIVALESEFGVSISIADSIEMVTVEKIRSVLRKYGVRC
jgi:acyl carrier protein